MTDSQTVTDFASRLRRLRIAKGWSQERLAAETDLAHRTITRLESGEVSCPTRSTLRLLAMALEVEVGDLLANGDEGAAA